MVPPQVLMWAVVGSAQPSVGLSSDEPQTENGQRHDCRDVRQHPMHHQGDQVVEDERRRLLTGPGSTTGT